MVQRKRNSRSDPEWKKTGSDARVYDGRDPVDAKMRLLFETIPDSLFFMDAEHTILRANECAGKFLGVKPSSLEGNKCFVWVHGTDGPHPACPLVRSITSGKAERSRIRIGDRWCSVDVIPIREKGTTTGYLHTMRDVTEQTEAEEALVRERYMARCYLDTANIIMVALDRKGRVELVNRKGCELLGYEEEELIGKDWFMMGLPGSIRKEVRRSFGELISGRIESESTKCNPVLTRDGEERIIRWYNSVLKDEHGRITGTLSSGEDVTQEELSLEELSLEELFRIDVRFRTIFNSISDAIIMVDTDRNIIAVNEATTWLFGYGSEELIGRSASVIYPDRESFLERGEQNYGPEAEPLDQLFVTTYRRKDGTLFRAETLGTPIRTNEGKILGFIGIHRDITEREHASEQQSRRLVFESMIREISTRFINIEMTEMDSTIHWAFELIGGYMGVDSISLMRVNRGRDTMTCTHAWASPTFRGKELTGITMSSNDFRWSMKQIRAMGHLIVPDVDELPPAAAALKKKLGDIRVKAVLMVPIASIHGVSGVLMHSSTDGRNWTDEDIRVMNQVCIIFAQIFERQLVMGKLESTLRDKDVLIREIHHRVKNNMQLISSLLELQAYQIEDETIRQIFMDSQNRVRSMAIIHEELYRSDDLGRKLSTEYICRLAEQLFSIYGGSAAGIRLEMDVDDLPLDMDSAITCGLIINELVSNALKYAFLGRGHGTISMSMEQNVEGEFELRISDDGVGLPGNVDIENTMTLGLQLVHMLTRQISGDLRVDRDNGTSFTLNFSERR